MTYTIIVEQGRNGFCAHSPDIPGVGATGRTLKGTKRRYLEAVEFHFEGMGADRPAFPGPNDVPQFVVEDAEEDDEADAATG
jgi:predicted RNase H-like HicB family nuclease